MEDKIGIIVSPGFGAGWSTWGDVAQALDQELAKAIDEGGQKEVDEIAKKNWPDAFCGGLNGCIVVWVDHGTEFMIDEYDGSESILYREDGDLWTKAK